MAVLEAEIKQVAKAISKVSDADVETAWGIIKAWALAHIPGTFSATTVSSTAFIFSCVCYLSDRFKNVQKVEAKTANEASYTELEIVGDGVFIAKENYINKKVELKIQHGWNERLTDVEAVLARMTAELAIQINKSLIAVDSTSQSFDVTTVTTKFNWADFEEYKKMLKKYYVDDVNKKQIGCVL